MRLSMQLLVAVALVVMPYVAVSGHWETSDLEETINLKLDKVSFFKKKPGSNFWNKWNSLQIPFGNDKNAETANGKGHIAKIKGKISSLKDKLGNISTNLSGSFLGNRSKNVEPNRIGENGDAMYGYDGGPGTSNWGGACASGSAQSPIDFNPQDTVAAYRRVFKFTGAQQTPQSTNITNSGHSVKVKLRTAKPITVTGGAFGDTVYEFQQMHFHWGKNANEGSEHTIKGKQFPLEGHLVFYKANVADPTAEPDGIAVLGVQYEISQKDNAVLETVVKSVGQITQPGQFVVRSGGVPLRDYLPRNLDTYFNYPGSLTTPPCTEGVTWVVFTEKPTVSDKQVSAFRTIKDSLGWKIEYNFRETQPLNGRKVLLVKSSERVVS